MGFYGNITNTNKSSLQFDKTYANRAEMDENCDHDGVFVGRYVLVDYDKRSIDATVAQEVNDSFNVENNPLSYLDVAQGLTKYYNYDLDTIQKKSSLIPAWMIIQTDGTVTFHTGASFAADQFVLIGDEEAKKAPYEVKKGDLLLVLGKRRFNTSIPSEMQWNPKRAFTSTELDYIMANEEADLIGIVRDSAGTVVERVVPEIWYCYDSEPTTVTYETSAGEQEYVYNLAKFRKETRNYEVDPVEADIGYYNDSDIFNFNYATDARKYPSVGRGWDSTVWQKTTRVVTVDGVQKTETKYVMIAELNSVVPTFDISVDAPTETPLMPHYSTDSSNVYYKLHVQPSWGMRIKSWHPDFSIDKDYYPSDVDGTFVVDSNLSDGSISRIGRRVKKSDNGSIVFDANGNAIIETYAIKSGTYAEAIDDADSTMPLAIYFNKAGFNPYQERTSEKDIERFGVNVKVDPNKDSIIMRPTGTSNNFYNYHVNNEGVLLQDRLPDTYELSIMLPSIGNTIAKIWNIVYGENSYLDAKGRMLWHQETGAFAMKDDPGSYVRNTEFDWDTYSGIRATYQDALEQDPITRGHKNGVLNYNKENLNTLAGSINTIHDLMGMIIRNYHRTNTDPDTKYWLSIDENINRSTTVNNYALIPSQWDPTKIYFVDGAYYSKHKTYKYTPTDNTTVCVPVEEMIDFESSDVDYYRQDWGQLPSYTGNNESESEKYFVNYRKVNNRSVKDGDTDVYTYPTEEFIDGAIYGTLEPGVEQELNVEGYIPGRYYYKDTPVNGDGVVNYILDTAPTPTKKGEPYWNIKKATQVVGQEFYIPNRYWLVDRTTGVAKFCTEDSYEGAVAGSTDFVFYKAVSPSSITGETEEGEKIEYVRDDSTAKKVFIPTSVPARSHWTYEQGELSIYWDTAKTDLVEHIVFNNSADSPNIIFSGNDVPVSYEAPTYEAIGPSEGFATAWAIRVNHWTIVNDEEGNPKPYYSYTYKPRNANDIYYTIGLNDEYIVNVIPFTQYDKDHNHIYFYKRNNDYVSETYDGLRTDQGRLRNTLDSYGKTGYYTLEIDPPLAVYYDLSGKYYYKTPVDDWCRETLEKTATAEIKYYAEPTFTPISENARIFVPGKYFEDAAGKVPALTYDPNKTYYERIGRYVISDSRNIYKKGTLWNEAVIPVPNTVQLGTREEVWEAKELTGFAENLFTLHGLMLKTQKLLDSEHEETRDQSTVQGAINTLNDIIARFDEMVPSEFMMVDDYGRVHTGNYDTTQNGTYTNIGKPSASGNISASNNRWVKLTTWSNYNNTGKPHFKLEHQLAFTANPTTTSANKNNDAANAGDGLNAQGGDTINLYTPIVDSQGHVIGKNTETVTLPFGYKTISIGAQNTETYSESSNSTTATAGNTLDKSYSGSGNLIADNTQDTLAVNTGNKWIRIKNDISDSNGNTSTNDGFTISHEVHSINTSDNGRTDINDLIDEDVNNTINIPDWNYDNAGHIIEKHNHLYTLPFGFKSITGDSGVSVAANTQDIIKLAGDTWVNTVAQYDDENHIETIQFEHSTAHAATTTVGETGSTYNFGTTFKVLNVGIDDKGHVKDLNTHNVTLPTVTLVNSTSGNLVTGLTSFAANGTLTYAKEYVGNLNLTGYSNEQDSFITPTITVNNAFKAISNVLEKSNETISNRITNKLAELTTSVSASGGSMDANVRPESTIDVISAITQQNGLIATVSSTLVDKAGAAAAALVEAKGYADELVSGSEEDMKDYADSKAATAEQNAKDYVSTATFSYTTPPTPNPDYDPDDPDSEEYLPGTTTTKTIGEWIEFIMNNI